MFAKKWIAMALSAAMLAPLPALAVTEGQVEEAPEVSLDLSLNVDGTRYLPDASVYAGSEQNLPAWGNSDTAIAPEMAPGDDGFSDPYQYPGLTPGEAARAEKLLEAYAQGAAQGDGAAVLCALTDVAVAVYPLNPEDYDGERVYLLLPSTCLTDEELLAIIDAYHQLGITFDPAALSYRNCARGGGMECNRFLTQEERARYDGMAAQIERGVLTEAAIAGAETQGLVAQVDGRYFCGMENFALRPYRSMTDEELAAQLFALGYTATPTDYTAYEMEARQVWRQLGAPLSLGKVEISQGAYIPREMDGQGKVQWAGGSQEAVVLSAEDDSGYQRSFIAWFDQKTGELVRYGWNYQHQDMPDFVASAEAPGVRYVAHAETMDEAEYLALAAAAGDCLAEGRALAWQRQGTTALANWECAICAAQLTDALWLKVYLDPADGMVHGVEVEKYPTFLIDEETLPNG